jgi:hypothetical protein
VNPVYRDLILARVQAAIDAARAVTGIGHRGLKGQLREIVIRDLVRPLFPSDIGLGTGEIVAAFDKRPSQQQDVVIFDRSIVPPLLLEGTTGIFPIESVLSTIEIKTKLTALELKSSIDSAKQLLSMEYLPGEYNALDEPIQLASTVRGLIPAILAFDSDLSQSGKTELERFHEILGGSTHEPPIHMICVVGRGCWTWRLGEWKPWPRSYLLEEVVVFIAVLMNSYKAIALSRKAPRMGSYLI